MRGKAYRGGSITLGEFGLKALEPGWVTSRQLKPLGLRLRASSNVAGKYGLAFFRISPSQKSRPKHEWKRKGKPGVLGCGRQARAYFV